MTTQRNPFDVLYQGDSSQAVRRAAARYQDAASQAKNPFFAKQYQSPAGPTPSSSPFPPSGATGSFAPTPSFGERIQGAKQGISRFLTSPFGLDVGQQAAQSRLLGPFQKSLQAVSQAATTFPESRLGQVAQTLPIGGADITFGANQIARALPKVAQVADDSLSGLDAQMSTLRRAMSQAKSVGADVSALQDAHDAMNATRLNILENNLGPEKFARYQAVRDQLAQATAELAAFKEKTGGVKPAPFGSPERAAYDNARRIANEQGTPSKTKAQLVAQARKKVTAIRAEHDALLKDAYAGEMVTGAGPTEMAPRTSVQTGLPGMGQQAAQGRMLPEFQATAQESVPLIDQEALLAKEANKPLPGQAQMGVSHSPWDASTEQHFQAWLGKYIFQDEQPSVESGMKQFAKEYPEVITRGDSWPDIRRMAERSGYITDSKPRPEPAQAGTTSVMTPLEWARGAIAAHYLGQENQAVTTPRLKPADYGRAIKILREAARSGDEDAKALVKLVTTPSGVTAQESIRIHAMQSGPPVKVTPTREATPVIPQAASVKVAPTEVKPPITLGGEPSSELGGIQRPGEFPEAQATAGGTPPMHPTSGGVPPGVGGVPPGVGGVPPGSPPVSPVGGVPPAIPSPNPFGFRNPVAGLTQSQRIANVIRSTLHLTGHNENEVATPIMAERARLRPIVESTANRVGTLAQESARTLFQIAKDGTVPDLKGVDPTIKGAPTIQDIAARLPTYSPSLSQEQRAFIEDLGKRIQTYSDALKAQGVDIPSPRSDVMAGGYYLPRGSAAVGGADEPIKIRAGARSGVGKPGFLKPATFASQSEGIGAGYEYPPFAEAVRSYVRQLGNKAVDTYSANLLKAATDQGGSPFGRVLAAGESPSRNEGIAGFSGLENRAFPDAIANAVNKTLKAEGEPSGTGSALLRVQDTLNNWYRGVRATGDDSALAIQGLLGAATDPKATAQAWKVNFKAWGNEGDRVLAQYINDFDKDAAAPNSPLADYLARQGQTLSEVLVQHGTHIGGAETEYQLGQGMRGVANLPFIRQANRAFGYLGDSLRLSWARDAILDEIRGFGPLRQPRTMDEIVSSGDLDRIANAVNVMTGWSANPTGASVGKALLFAPRWFQSRLETVGKAALSLRPGGSSIDRRMARNSLLKLVAAGTVMTVAINTALGKETDFRLVVHDKEGKLRYNSGSFMRIKWNNHNWSIFGPWDSLARMVVNTGLSVQNPKLALDAYRGSASGVISNTLDLFNGKDYNYNPITDSPVHLAEYFLKDLVPFSGGPVAAGLAQAVTAKNPGDAAKGLATGALQFAGVKGRSLAKTEQTAQKRQAAIESLKQRGVIFATPIPARQGMPQGTSSIPNTASSPTRQSAIDYLKNRQLQPAGAP